jgi:hypothetical protein
VAAGLPGQRLEADCVAEGLGELRKRVEQVGVRVAGQRLARRLKWLRLDAGKRGDLVLREDGDGLEQRDCLVGGLAGVAVAALDGQWRVDQGRSVSAGTQ